MRISSLKTHTCCLEKLSWSLIRIIDSKNTQEVWISTLQPRAPASAINSSRFLRPPIRTLRRHGFPSATTHHDAGSTQQDQRNRNYCQRNLGSSPIFLCDSIRASHPFPIPITSWVGPWTREEILVGRVLRRTRARLCDYYRPGSLEM